MIALGLFLAAAAAAASSVVIVPVLAFQPRPAPSVARRPLPMPCTTMASSASSTAEAAVADESASKLHLYVPAERDERYGGNVARYLLDLHEEGATFDFCGGMMFQLVLSDMLKSHLETVASNEEGNNQPVMHPASQPLMSRIPDYQKSAFADNVSVFHGRELRNVPSANGGMDFVLQLSYADPEGSSSPVDEASGSVAGKGANAAWSGRALDPQGWSGEEIATYDGWRGDSFRKWRNGPIYEAEGYGAFREEFGKDAFGLNHRFYLHLDDKARMWLSAEDGCEGTPSEGRSFVGKLGGMLFGK